ncbi:MAG TPA: sigma-70 family RNA polymerase sigma factor [Candidatus Kapabacteria bacterium]|nr:sigma-70 family RNA polymerase sigma factor [Candidatus Kapabacteria bacterium]
MAVSALILSRSSNALVSKQTTNSGNGIASERNRASDGRARVTAASEVPAEVKPEKAGLFGARKKKAEVRSDVELILAFQAGDERAYAELYVRRKSEVYTFCLRMLGGDADAASDAFQEVFIKVYEKGDTFRDGTNVMGWLYMIARNTCLNVYRAKKPNDTLENHQSLMSSDRTLAPEFGQEQSFLRDMLEKAIASLPEEFREPFILREFDGFSYSEIAEMTGTTLAITKVRIHRAKQKMREILRPYLHEADNVDESVTLFRSNNADDNSSVED